jgi:hypothetical protein
MADQAERKAIPPTLLPGTVTNANITTTSKENVVEKIKSLLVLGPTNIQKSAVNKCSCLAIRTHNHHLHKYIFNKT